MKHLVTFWIESPAIATTASAIVQAPPFIENHILVSRATRQVLKGITKGHRKDLVFKVTAICKDYQK